MKFANDKSANQQVLTTELMLEQYTKVNNAVSVHIRETDFVCVILARCNGSFDVSKVPIKGVAVSRNELKSFYGDAYYQRLNRFS